MNYHNILHDDMRNGDGLRVVLFVSGCNHYCKKCQNPQTWNLKSGIKFDANAKEEIFEQLSKDYISGITFSGGDPLNINNLKDINKLIKEIKEKFPNKTIWIYTGYTWEQIKSEIDTWHQDELALSQIINSIDVLVDGLFEIDKLDVNYHWAGSTNQRVINVKETLKLGKIILYERTHK